MAASKFITHLLEGVQVDQRFKDGYLNATKLSKAYLSKTGKTRKPSQWLLNKDTEDLIQQLSSSTGHPADQLVITVKGGLNEQRGTFIHPDIAPAFISWLESGGKNRTSDYLYLVKAQGTSIFKIGIASDVDDRLATMQIGSPLKLELLRAVKRSDARKVEAQLHQKFDEYRSHGEWFSLPESDATKAFDDISGASDFTHLTSIFAAATNVAPIVHEGMINATHLESLHHQKGGDRTLTEWMEDEATQRAIESLGEKYGLDSDDIITKIEDGPSLLRGVYIHPRLTVRLLCWIDNDFGLAVEDFAAEMRSRLLS